jgi:protein transport protein SEC13
MDSSVNAVAWAPLEFGLVLACGCSDSQILVVKYVEGQWNETLFPAHGGGVTCLSWGPALSSGSLTSKAASEFAAVPRLVSGGVDNAVRVWRFEADQWVQDPSFSYSPETGHSLCVRDVAWAPSIGLASGTIASCGDDQSVIIWVEKNTGEWQAKERLSFDEGTWRVSWSVMGNLLAVSYGENKVSMWKESLDGKWKTLSTMTGGSEGESKSS